MKTDELLTLQRLTNVVSDRYGQMNGNLQDAMDKLDMVLEAMPESEPLGHEIDAVLRLLVSAIREGSELQWEVIDMLRHQLAQSRSAKQAYENGWDNRLTDLFARATPEQAGLLRELLRDDTDDQIPF